MVTEGVGASASGGRGASLVHPSAPRAAAASRNRVEAILEILCARGRLETTGDHECGRSGDGDENETR